MSLNALLSKGYTFAPGGKIYSKVAEEILEKLIDQAEKRDPERHNLSLYNDFYGYAILDLIDHTLSKIHTKIIKKNWMEAWQILEALTFFVEDVVDDWTMCDDGDRVILTDIAYGALLITTIRKLQNDNVFDEEHIPNLELVLMKCTSWGSAMDDISDSKYVRVLRGVGREIFGCQSEATRNARAESDKALYHEWLDQNEEKKAIHDILTSRSEEDEEDEGDEDDEDTKKKKKKKWYAGKGDADMKDKSLQMTRTWKEYKEYLADAPTKPFMGPPIWDLTKWSKADKAEYSYDRFKESNGYESEDMFF